jgi:hypothetical protein
MMMNILRVIVYGVAAIACWHSGIQCAHHFNRLARRVALVWWILGAILIAIAVVRVLDLDIQITGIFRDSAQAHDWYFRRHQSQAIMLAFGILCILVLVTGVQSLLGSYAKMMFGPVIGAAVLGVMELARFVSMHETDKFFGASVGLPLSWIVQLMAIAAILYGVRLCLAGEPMAPIKIKPRPPEQRPPETRPPEPDVVAQDKET